MVAITIERNIETQATSNGRLPASNVSLSAILAGVPLFETMDQESLERLAAFAFRCSFAAGERIIEEGHTANGLYVVLSGEVDIVKGLDGATPDVVATLGAGEPLGEMEILASWPRTASAVAREQVEVLGIDSWVFLDYLQEEPKLAMRLLQIMARRLAETSARLAED
jgi:CRP-like cAMP-binding protein